MPDIRQLARLVREHDIQLIHAHRGKDHWQAALAVKLYRLRVPVIRTRHVVMPLSANFANRWLARKTAALVAVSKAVAEDVRRTGMYNDRLHLIPGGIDLNLFVPATAEQKAAARAGLGLPLEARIAICVARFAQVKAHAVLLAAWRKVRQELPSARLLLVGEGHLREELQALAQKLGITESVSFLGWRDDVPELLKASDAGVLSSVGSEGFSRATLEYMAAGLPAVGTRVGAIPDLIADGVTGILVAPKDEQGLSAALLRVLSASESERQAWGSAARAAAVRSYGYNSWAGAHERLYESVLEKA